MLKLKQLFINAILVALAICIGAGTIMAVKADDFVYGTCNGVFIDFYIDEDGDGFGDSSATSTPACSAPDNYVANNFDCDDTNANIKPGVDEICDGVDNNCDGNINEGLATSTYFMDADGDEYGDASSTIDWCALPEGYVSQNQDCDDTDASINPDATEICDVFDNNCDGNINEGLATSTYFIDADGDEYGDASSTMDWCALPDGYVSRNQDCDDSNASTSPEVEEICDDGIDNNCNGEVDENCEEPTATTTRYYLDSDGDGYGDPADFVDSTTRPTGYVLDNTDCDDSSATTSPAATEICGDGIDNDCSGGDEACVLTYYSDDDGDGYGNPADSVSSTTQPTGYVLNNTDCNDSSATTSPAATEICGDNIDNNCDGEIDENCVDITSEDNDDFTECHPCEGSFRNHGAFMSCLAHYTNCLKGIGEITGREKGQIMSSKDNKYKFQMNIKTQGNSNNSNNGKAKGKNK